MLQPARIIHPPLLHRRIPAVGEPLALGLHRGHAADGTLRAGEAVALQLQPPLPPAIPRLGDKPTPVELRGPLLPRIARLPSAFDGLEGVPSRLVSGADTVPVGFGEPVRHLVGRGELLRLPRRRGRRERDGEGEENTGTEEAGEFHGVN